MAYFNNLALGGPLTTVPQFENRLGFLASKDFELSRTELNSKLRYGYVKNKIGLDSTQAYVVRYYTTDDQLIYSLEGSCEEIALPNDSYGVALFSDIYSPEDDEMIEMPILYDGFSFIQTEENGVINTEWEAADGYWILHPLYFLNNQMGNVNIVIEGKDINGNDLCHELQIEWSIPAEILPNSLRRLVIPDNSYSELGYQFKTTNAVLLDSNLGGYYLYPHKLNLKAGNTYEIALIPNNGTYEDATEKHQVVAQNYEGIPGAVTIDLGVSYGTRKGGTGGKSSEEKNQTKGSMGILVDGVIPNENGQFEQGDGLILNNYWFYNMEHAMQNYSPEQQEMIKKSYLAIYGEDIEGNPLRHTVTIAPTLETNITGMARTIGGLRTSIQELNNPCGKHDDIYVPTSGEIFNDYEYGQAPGEYSHFEGQNTQEEIGIGYRINNSHYRLLVEQETAAILNSLPTYPYAIYNEINTLKGFDIDKVETICAPAVVIRLTEDIEYLKETSATVRLYTTDGTELAVDLYSIGATGQILTAISELVKGLTDFGKIVAGTTYKIKKEDDTYINVTIDKIITPSDADSYHIAQFDKEIIKKENPICLTGGAFGLASHAEGVGNLILGDASHAQGISNIIEGEASFASGSFNKVYNDNANALGNELIVTTDDQTVVGSYNIERYHEDGIADAKFIVGGGNSTARSNAFVVRGDGTVEGVQTLNAAGADYAEYYEWADGNPEGEDRRGLFVTFADEDKIRVANSADDYILGVVSANASIIGNAYTDRWQGQYLTDIYGQLIVEVIEHEEEIIRNEQEEVIEIIPAYTETRLALNPEYDPSKEYVGRNRRNEWAAIGTHGQLVLKDNGKCEVNSYCEPGENGLAVPSQYHEYRVIKRLDDNHIKVVLK